MKVYKRKTKESRSKLKFRIIFLSIVAINFLWLLLGGRYIKDEHIWFELRRVSSVIIYSLAAVNIIITIPVKTLKHIKVKIVDVVRKTRK